MKILVIGASRGLGRVLVDQCLEAGHRVTVLLRNIFSMGASRPNLLGIHGSILQGDPVLEAVRGQDAVCVTVGIRPTFERVDVFAKGTRIVVDAMEKAGVRRLLCVTGVGTGESRGHGGFVHDRLIQPTLLRTVYADKEAQEEVVRASGTRWTLVRPGPLTNGPSTGRYRVVTDLTGVTATSVSRQDVAQFLLQALTTDAYASQAVLVDSGHGSDSKVTHGSRVAVRYR